MQPRRELPVLGAIAGALHWLEELLIIVSGPLLTLGLGIALVDLLTGGALLATQPGLLYMWATSQAVGVDAQLVGSAALLAMAVHARRPWIAAFYGLLLVPLAYVGFTASYVFATQESEGISTAQALTRLGMDSTSWIVQRSALAVALVVLSGLLRYRPPAAEASAEHERERLARELELEPLRAQLRARKVAGMRDVAAAAMGKQHASEMPNRPPTGPGSPVALPRSAEAASAATDARGGIHALPSPKRARGASKPPNTRTANAEQRARAVWHNEMTVSDLARASKLSMSAASKWAKVLRGETRQEAAL